MKWTEPTYRLVFLAILTATLIVTLFGGLVIPRRYTSEQLLKRSEVDDLLKTCPLYVNRARINDLMLQRDAFAAKLLRGETLSVGENAEFDKVLLSLQALTGPKVYFGQMRTSITPFVDVSVDVSTGPPSSSTEGTPLVAAGPAATLPNAVTTGGATGTPAAVSDLSPTNPHSAGAGQASAVLSEAKEITTVLVTPQVRWGNVIFAFIAYTTAAGLAIFARPVAGRTSTDYATLQIDQGLAEEVSGSLQTAESMQFRSNVLLIAGVAMAFIGVGIFYFTMPEPPGVRTPATFKEEVSLYWMVTARNAGVLFFMESIAWFLLRQYRSTLEDYKLFYRTYMGRVNSALAYKVLSPVENEKIWFGKTLLAQDFSGRMRSDETTDSIEALKLAQNDLPNASTLQNFIQGLFQSEPPTTGAKTK